MIGTHHYHSHVNDDFQIDQGLDGPLIVDAAPPSGEIDALYVIGSYKIGGSEQENAFVLNGKAYPDAPVLTVPLGAKVRIRMINASAEDEHVMHLHGYTFQVAALDGNPVANPIDANTLNLGASQTGDVVFVANNPGEWMFHCHIMDHVINPGPNGDGSATQMADMGGLMSFIHVVPTGSDAVPSYVAAGSVMMMHH
jgi:FtsP/CotA-like multicopper oxidase with cupredoxin domain